MLEMIRFSILKIQSYPRYRSYGVIFFSIRILSKTAILSYTFWLDGIRHSLDNLTNIHHMWVISEHITGFGPMKLMAIVKNKRTDNNFLLLS